MPINTKIDRKNLYLRLSSIDITTRILPLLRNGTFIRRPTDGKFVYKNPVMPFNAPWCYTRTDSKARCGLYHQIFFNCYGHIHSYCRECYKVVIRPRNLVQMFDWYEVQRTIIDSPCKLGLERRDSVGALYGAYHYFRGKEAGIKGYQELKKLVAEHLSADVPILLKRYCTEFEITDSGHKPSDKTPDATPAEKEWEQWVISHFGESEGIAGAVGGGYPTDAIAHVMREWIHYAYKNGDLTYKEFTNGDSLFPAYVTYHQEEPKDASST